LRAGGRGWEPALSNTYGSSLAIFFGLVAAFAWAGADFLARHVSRRIGPTRAFILMQCVGLATLTLYLAILKDPHWSFASAMSDPARRAWGWAVVAALLNIVASTSLYRAFATGKMALVTPIAASYPVLTVVLALASGERLKPSAAVGIPIVLLGVMLALIPAGVKAAYSAEAGRSPDLQSGEHPGAQPGVHPGLNPGLSNDRAGIGWALAAAAGFGLLFWVLGFRVTGILGGVVPIWIIRLTGASLILGLVLQPSRTTLPRGSIWWALAGSALLDTTAFVASTLGLSTGHVSVVTVLASLFGVLIVLLSWVLLKERLHWRQWCGVALIFAGVALVSM
jgi:drug/metabolite transporter (DMT)-like permease